MDYGRNIYFKGDYMDDRKLPEIEVNNVIVVGFAMLDKPIDVQLTIHINNLINTYGKDLIKEFKLKLYNPENDYHGGQQIKQLVNHYGLDTVKNWFTLIYGWDFTQKAG